MDLPGADIEIYHQVLHLSIGIDEMGLFSDEWPGLDRQWGFFFSLPEYSYIFKIAC